MWLSKIARVYQWLFGVFSKKESNLNERLFKEFTENINEVFWRATPDLSKTIYVSAAYNEIWGRPRENLFKNPQEWAESIVPEDQERVRAILLSLTQEDVPKVSFEFTIMRPNGDLRHIYTRGFKFINKKGELESILGISTDITTYKLEEQAKIVLSDIKNMLDRESSLAIILPKVLQIICIAHKWDFGEVWLIDKEANVLRSVSLWDNAEWNTVTSFDAKSKRITFRPGVSLPGEIWRSGKLTWIEDLNAVDLIRMKEIRMKEAANAGIHSAVGVPIFVKNNIIGVLDFFSHSIKKPTDIIRKMMETVAAQIGEFVEKKHTEDQVEYAARHDAQSSLFNRSALKDNIKKILATSITSGIPFAVILFEIDRFQRINSAIGQDASDMLLRLVVERFRKIAPQINEQIGRYETNVFALYLSYHLIDEVIQCAHTILEVFNEPFFIKHEYIYLSANIGISIFPENGNEINELFKNANLALNRSVKMGKNNFNFFSSDITNIVSEQLTLEASLRQALFNNEFCLYYQPKVSLLTGEISGIEALIRWQHPTKGLLQPSSFIRLAEETGLIVQIDEWVLRTVFTLIKNEWPMNPNGKGLISINISPQHFKEKYNILSYIEDLIQAFNVNPRLIEIEITEMVLLDESQYNISVLNKLIDMGFSLSLDDFGTGFNSLSYLLRVPAHNIKIDKSFIDGLPDDKKSIAVVRSVITLCHSLDKKVIAEGVETLAQAQFLKNEGCDEIQGYYFSRPVPLEEFKILLDEHKKLIL